MSLLDEYYLQNDSDSPVWDDELTAEELSELQEAEGERKYQADKEERANEKL